MRQRCAQTPRISFTRRWAPGPITIGLVAFAGSGIQNSGILPSEGVIIRRPSMLIRREEGQGLAEYALILALIAIVAVVALLFLGGVISTILSTIGKAL